jgi:hypothetical protein
MTTFVDKVQTVVAPPVIPASSAAGRSTIRVARATFRPVRFALRAVRRTARRAFRTTFRPARRILRATLAARRLARLACLFLRGITIPHPNFREIQRMLPPRYPSCP